MLRGSYYNGFAPRDGMPLYASLWRGCIGAWAPCLGPSGLTLRDWSGYANHGTLTNMAADSDWVISAGNYCLDFDGVDDHVLLANYPATTAWTVAAWVNMTSVKTYPSPVSITFGASTNNGIIVRGSWYQMIRNNVTVNNEGQLLITLGQWVHLAAVFDGTSGRLWGNGVSLTGGAGDSGWSVSGSRIGDGFSTDKFPGRIDDVRVYNRALNAAEICLLASRRGIAYDLAPFAMPYSEQGAGFQAAWALRQRLILGGGGGLG